MSPPVLTEETLKDIENKFMANLGKILDRLLKGPGAKKDTKYYSESVIGEYEFLRKKAREVSEGINEAKASRDKDRKP